MFNQNQFMGCDPMFYPPQNNARGQMMGRNQFVPSTNKQFVRSLEEALSLPANLNSQNVYFDINRDVMYDICTNGQGEKSWAVFSISLQNSNGRTASTALAADPYEERFSRIESKLEEIINGKHNAKQTNATNAESV
jgi:hypothetical protein